MSNASLTGTSSLPSIKKWYLHPMFMTFIMIWERKYWALALAAGRASDPLYEGTITTTDRISCNVFRNGSCGDAEPTYWTCGVWLKAVRFSTTFETSRCTEARACSRVVFCSASNMPLKSAWLYTPPLVAYSKLNWAFWQAWRMMAPLLGALDWARSCMAMGNRYQMRSVWPDAPAPR